MRSSLEGLSSWASSKKYLKKGRGGRAYPEEFRLRIIAEAKKHGACKVARATGVSGCTIKKWISGGTQPSKSGESLPFQLVELGNLPLGRKDGSGEQPEEDRVEIVSENGARLSFRCSERLRLELARLMLEGGGR